MLAFGSHRVDGRGHGKERLLRADMLAILYDSCCGGGSRMWDVATGIVRTACTRTDRVHCCILDDGEALALSPTTLVKTSAKASPPATGLLARFDAARSRSRCLVARHFLSAGHGPHAPAAGATCCLHPPPPWQPCTLMDPASRSLPQSHTHPAPPDRTVTSV